MNKKTTDNKEYKYIIRKFSQTSKKPEIFAEFKISSNGELAYKMLCKDNEIQNILELVKKQKGLECSIPFKGNVGGLNVFGQKKSYVETTDFTHIMDAIEQKLESGLVDRIQ